MICKNCGASSPDGVMFCGNCGTRMDVQEQPAPSPQPAQQQYSNFTPVKTSSDPLREPLSTGSYMLMMLVSFIPIVNLIMLLVWAFSSDTNLNRKNWSRAMLIWWLIGIGLSILLFIAIAALGASLFNSLGELGEFSYDFSY
ncbi:MAG: hypothetical protein BWY11_01265 [Firmicutes bacterium ADurb.Bin182]|nr:MAG: hypothetical protein BWY11_01265 [Firmicutes bacterium ADurb.Bin182]